MMANYDIQLFSINSANEEEKELWYELKACFHAETLPQEPFAPKTELLDQEIRLNSIQNSTEWAIWNNNKSMMIGKCRIHTHKTSSEKEIAGFSLLIRESFRRQGLGTACLKHILNSAEESGYKLLRTQSSDYCSASGEFLQEIGCRVIGTSHWNELLLKDLNHKAVETWINLPDTSSLQINIHECYGTFPDDFIEKITNFYQIVYDAEPAKDGVRKEEIHFSPEDIREGDKLFFANGNKQRIVIYATEATSEKLLGITSLVWVPSRPAKLSQYYTAVTPEVRQMGIAKRLKAEMITKIRNELPEAEKIWSGNADSNDAMLSINRKLGFKPCIASTSWEIETDTLSRYYDKLKSAEIFANN